MIVAKNDLEVPIIKLFYELTLLQRGIQKNDTSSIDAMFRIMHNVSSMAIEGCGLDAIYTRYNEMCLDNFSDIIILDDLVKVGRVLK